MAILTPYRNPGDLVFKRLRSEVDQSIDMNVDGSSTPVAFSYANTTEDLYVLSRANWSIRDANPTAIKFGGLAELTNGLLMRVMNAEGKIVLDMLDGFPLTKNLDFGILAGTDWARDVAAGAADVVTVKWTFARTGKRLLLPAGHKFQVVVQDNLTTLDEFKVMVQGYRLDKNEE